MELSERIGRFMKLQNLHVFMTVVQAGSMGKAAQSLNTTQPNISRSIAELEHNLGVRLLHRNSQGVEPTEYGRALLDGGVAVFDDLRQAVKKIEFLTDPAAGEVRIGCHHFLAGSFVTAVVDRLSRRYPRIVFSIVAAQTERLWRDLNERNVDLLVAWRMGPFADDRTQFDALYDDTHVVAAGSKNPWARRRKVAFPDLADEMWTLSPPESVLGTISMEAFRASGLPYPRATVLSLPTEVRLGLLATGRFLTILSTTVLRFPTRPPDIKVLPVELPIVSVPIGIVTLKGRMVSPTARLFIEHAREVANAAGEV